ncbi:cell division protein FtsZ [Sulfurovum sp. CS9]|uniref:cell division protein FtsZ n=1 Tax=Sulfurovum sp. CS9 TaxID=3391146 RepID=UPI0039EA79EA
MEEFNIKITEKKIGNKGAKIAVIGVGGAGCKVLDLLSESDIRDKIKLVAVDEKGNNVESRKADVKITLLKDKPFSFHEIMPERGREGALEVYEEIKEALIQ